MSCRLAPTLGLVSEQIGVALDIIESTVQNMVLTTFLILKKSFYDQNRNDTDSFLLNILRHIN